jgi:hypothetical protein
VPVFFQEDAGKDKETGETAKVETAKPEEAKEEAKDPAKDPAKDVKEMKEVKEAVKTEDKEDKKPEDDDVVLVKDDDDKKEVRSLHMQITSSFAAKCRHISS